ncbi:major facilitator superfamily domain-containing protein, partial [Thamnocephalis sphaerospora]
PEGGYGWLVVLSAFFINFTVFGSTYTWGVYQELYLTDIYKGQITTFQLTFAGGLGMALIYTSGPFFGALRQRFGIKLLMCAGAVLQPLGLLLASWANSPWHLYLTHGLIAGFGASLVYFPSMFLPTQWFMKRRGLATGVAVSGSGIGGLVFGPLTRVLIDTVGFRWCLRYTAIGSFVIFVVAVLLARDSQIQATRQKIIDVSLLKRADFAALTMMTTLAIFGYIIPFYFLPSYATFIGLSTTDGALFVGLTTGINAAGRIFLGYAADVLGRVNTLFTCVLFTGVTVLLIWTFSTSYGVLLLFVLLYGFIAGGFVSLLPVVMAELVGRSFELRIILDAIIESSRSTLGYLFGPPIAGALLDATAPNTSYLPVQLFCGITTVLASTFVAWLRVMRTKKWFVRV